MNDLKITNFLIEDVSWTLKNFAEKIKEWENTPWYDRNEQDDPYNNAAHAALIIAKKGFGDCFPIDTFIEDVKNGGFIDYDGSGYFVNTEGNKIYSIRCDAKWLQNNTPEDAKFIMWFNK